MGPRKIRKRAEGLNLKSESYLILARIPKRHASNLRTSRVSARSYRILISEIARKHDTNTDADLVGLRFEGLVGAWNLKLFGCV